MKQEELDQFMRDAASKGEIPFETGHWEQFNDLLGSEVKSKKRRKERRMIWWLGTISMGIGALAVYYFNFNRPVISDPLQPTSMQQETAIESLDNVASHDDHADLIHDNAATAIKAGNGISPQVKVSNDVLTDKKVTGETTARQQTAGTNDPADKTTVDDKTDNSATPQFAKGNTAIIGDLPDEHPDHTNWQDSDGKKGTARPEDDHKAVSNEEPENTTTAAGDSLTVKDTSNNNVLVNANPATIDSTPVPPVVPKRIKRWKVAAFAGPGIYSQNVQLAEDEAKDFRNDNEASKLSLDLGVEVNYLITGSFRINSGLNYYTMGREYNFPDRSSETLNITDNGFWNVKDNSYWQYTDSARTPVGGWIYTDSVYHQLLDSSYVEQYDTTKTKITREGASGKSSWRMISIPVMVGYTFHFTKFDLVVQTGVGLEYLAGVSGRTIDAGGNIAEINDIYNLKKLNVSWLVGVAADYKINDSFFIGIQPNLRLPLNSSSKDRDTNIKYSNVALRLRAGIKF